MKRKFFLLLVLFLLTGCSCNYNLKINKDLTVSEEIVIRGTQKLYAAYYKTTKTSVLQENLDNYTEELAENNYSYTLVSSDEPYIVIYKTYKNMDDYLNNSKVFNEYFDEIKYNKNGNIVNIETIGFNQNEEDNPDRFYVESANINFELAYEMDENNCEKIDKEKNICQYSLSEDSEDFKIMFNYDLSKRFNPYKMNMILVVIGVVIIIITWTTMFFINRKKKI